MRGWPLALVLSVVLILGFLSAAGLYASGPAHKTVTYTATRQVEAQCNYAGVKEEDIPGVGSALGSFPTEQECLDYSGYGTFWESAREEEYPSTRRERTNAWERLKGAITGEP